MKMPNRVLAKEPLHEPARGPEGRDQALDRRADMAGRDLGVEAGVRIPRADIEAGEDHGDDREGDGPGPRLLGMEPHRVVLDLSSTRAVVETGQALRRQPRA